MSTSQLSLVPSTQPLTNTTKPPQKKLIGLSFTLVAEIFSFLSLDSIVVCRNTCKAFAPGLEKWGKSVKHLNTVSLFEIAVEFFKFLKIENQTPFFPRVESLMVYLAPNNFKKSSHAEIIYKRIIFHCGSAQKMLLCTESTENATSFLRGFKNIRCLTIYGIKDTTPELVEAVPKLEQLNLLEASKAVHAATVKQLNRIRFTTHVSNTTLALFSNHDNLRHVHIIKEDNSITKKGVEYLLSIPNLETLELQSYTLQNLEKAKNLKKLSLHEFSNTNAALHMIVKCQIPLTDLRLHTCTTFDDVGCEHIGQFSELQYLALKTNFWHAGSGEFAIWSNITDKGLKAIGQCKKLKKIEISGCHTDDITTKGIIDLINELPLLEEIDLSLKDNLCRLNVGEMQAAFKTTRPSLYVKTEKDCPFTNSEVYWRYIWPLFREAHPELSHIL